LGVLAALLGSVLRRAMRRGPSRPLHSKMPAMRGDTNAIPGAIIALALLLAVRSLRVSRRRRLPLFGYL